MKQSVVPFLFSFLLSQALSAQTPFYLMFDPKCTNQLEYQFTYTGRNLLMYSVANGANELYFFVIGSGTPVTSAKAPNGTVSCGNSTLDASLIENINAGGRFAYVVSKAQNGYTSMPVESAGYIARSGTYFAFRSPNYDFVMDTASINYARNLSRPGVTSPVYLTGRRSQDCLQLYAFRLEPTSPESPRADVEVIPGIGIISDRTGLNGSEMEQNVYRLLKVNGISLEDYIYAVCTNPKENEGATGTFITNLPAGTNPNDAFKAENPFPEPDKEGYSTQTPGKVQLADCPTQPGYGYHIVQPGDSLRSIARIYNLDMKSLMTWNNLQNPQQIKVCDKIWLSPQSPATPAAGQTTGIHVVQKGETLSSISRKYSVTVATVKQWNNLKSDEIQAGQRLVVSNKAQQKPAQNSTSGNTAPATYSTNPGPGASGRMAHKVQKGETLNSVAWQYGYTTPYLLHINRNNKNLPTNEKDNLTEGLVLIVSDSKGDREDFSSYVPPVTYSPGKQGFVPAAAPPSSANPPVSTVSPFGNQTNLTKFEYVGEYIVQNDDTLASIAQRYGLKPEKLAAANNLKPGQEPAPRSILKIPK
jgi:LysM repeat protein